MAGLDIPAGSPASAQTDGCYFFKFGLIVTGKGEQAHLPNLLKSLVATGICSFEVLGRIGQRNHISSPDRTLRMVGKGQKLPTRDEEEIGLPSRKYLDDDPCCFIILIDDLEYDRQEHHQHIFERYKRAFDTILNPAQRLRASVHFLVNMLEAYYFADARAINLVLPISPPLEDYPGNVEDIRNPKGRLKSLSPGFDEITDGGMILDFIDIDHVLSRPDTCAGLRTLFAWCSKVLERYPHYESLNLNLNDKYHLDDGVLSEVTQVQLASL